jgi:adenosine deaminase
MNWFEHVPKVELHLHLEGAIPYSALWDLVQKYGGAPDLPDLETLKQKLYHLNNPGKPPII